MNKTERMENILSQLQRNNIIAMERMETETNRSLSWNNLDSLFSQVK